MYRPVQCIVVFCGVALVLFGLLCLNYSSPSGVERHRQFASDHRLPPPSETILFSGAAAIIAGSALLGYRLGRRNKNHCSPNPNRAHIST